MPSKLLLLLYIAVATQGLAALAQASCPRKPGAARAACVCKSVKKYRYYADKVNGCTGAVWCHGPGQSTYVRCQADLLFSNSAQACDLAANVQCNRSPSNNATSPSPSPSPKPPSPAPQSPGPRPRLKASPSPKPVSTTCMQFTQPGGACGASNSGLCCPNSQCCSAFGYCGISDAHCGTGCQTAYGSCSGAPPVVRSPSPSPSYSSPSPSPGPVASPSPKPSPALDSPQPTNPRGTLPAGPLVVGYYQSWSAPWASSGAALDLAKLPSYLNVVIVSFVKPDCTYRKGSLTLSGTGLDFSSDGVVVKDAISALKVVQPNTRILLAVGGATYYNFAGLNVQCIKAIVDDFGFDGVDLDYEPSSSCVVSGGKVTCPGTDAESVAVTTALREALPKGQYLLSTASWHVGCYGEGDFAAAQPVSAYTGVNLAMARSLAGQTLDLVNIMAYDAGNKQSTGFDWAESYRAHKAVWKTQAIAIGVEIPPEAWGGNIITLPQVTERANYARAMSAGAQFGIMLWSLHKQGCPNAQQIVTAACTAFNMGGCSTPLPFSQSACSNPSPVSPSPAVPNPSPSPTQNPKPSPSPVPSGGNTGSCSAGYAQPGGACGEANGGLCCSGGQCCSQYGYCGTTAVHCGTGCQVEYGFCSGSEPGSPSPSPSPVTSPKPSSSPAPAQSPTPAPTGSVSDYITPALFEQIFLHRNDQACTSNGFYTYTAFVAAAAAFPGFGTAGDATTNKRELAAFLAQISHETTGGWPSAPDGAYSWGLCWIREGMKAPVDQLAPYCAPSAEFPCAAGKKYFGRGPMQLSWNYNYIPAGIALGFDGLNNPDAVIQDPVLAFKTAIWFWMTPQDPKPSCHNVMVGTWTPSAADIAAGRLPGFGLTTNIINGGLECGSKTVQGQEADRIGFYRRYAELFGVSVGDNIDCANQQHY